LQEFQDCFKKRKTRLDRCIASNRQYFEGDSICNTNKYTIFYYKYTVSFWSPYIKQPVNLQFCIIFR
jgi:hypothetical protein